MIIKNALKIMPKHPGLTFAGTLLKEGEWHYVSGFVIKLPKDLYYVMIPIIDWGEDCPECSVGTLDDEWGDIDLCCDNCGWEPPWVFTNLRWRMAGRKRFSKKKSRKKSAPEVDSST